MFLLYSAQLDLYVVPHCGNGSSQAQSLLILLVTYPANSIVSHTPKSQHFNQRIILYSFRWLFLLLEKFIIAWGLRWVPSPSYSLLFWFRFKYIWHIVFILWFRLVGRYFIASPRISSPLIFHFLSLFSRGKSLEKIAFTLSSLTREF